MSQADFALVFFQFALPVCAMAVAFIALYTINRSPMIQQMKDEYSHNKLLARVQEIEGDWRSFEKGMDAALGAMDQKLEAVSDRLTAHQKRKRYYDGQDAAAAGSRSTQQVQRAVADAAEQGMNLDGTVADSPTLPGMEAAVAPENRMMTLGQRQELVSKFKQRLRHGKSPGVNGEVA